MATVLIVDDDPNTRQLVTMLLRHAGHTPLEAPDGRQALSIAVEHAPDLIILDLSLPTMPGPEFMCALRKNPHTRSTHVALYTATQLTPALRDFMAIYDIATAIPKPSTPQQFLEALATALERKA